MKSVKRYSGIAVYGDVLTLDQALAFAERDPQDSP